MNRICSVSIVTVCLNSERTIEKTFNSVVLQNYPNIEYVVVDGASIDSTVNLIKSCSAVTKWISEPDKGISDAFNKGIALASGEWIGIINADDWYESGAIESAMRHANDADIIHGPVRYWKSNTPIGVYYPNQTLLRREMSINHPSVFVRRSVYEALGGFDTSYLYAMDYEFLLRALVAGYRFSAITDVVLANMSTEGVSDLYWKKSIFEVKRAKDRQSPSFLCNNIYFLMQLCRGYGRRFFEFLGLNEFVRFFRKYFSVMRKI